MGTILRGQTTNTDIGRFIGFEQYYGGFQMRRATDISGILFDSNWGVGDFRERNSDGSPYYNGKYPIDGGFTCDGWNFVYLGRYIDSGRIDFIIGGATFVSLLASTQGISYPITTHGIKLEAYDINDNLVDIAPIPVRPYQSGFTRSNYNTGYMDKVTVSSNIPNIAYVIVTGSANYFLIDDIVTDSPGTSCILKRDEGIYSKDRYCYTGEGIFTNK